MTVKRKFLNWHPAKEIKRITEEKYLNSIVLQKKDWEIFLCLEVSGNQRNLNTIKKNLVEILDLVRKFYRFDYSVYIGIPDYISNISSSIKRLIGIFDNNLVILVKCVSNK